MRVLSFALLLCLCCLSSCSRFQTPSFPHVDVVLPPEQKSQVRSAYEKHFARLGELAFLADLRLELSEEKHLRFRQVTVFCEPDYLYLEQLTDPGNQLLQRIEINAEELFVESPSERKIYQRNEENIEQFIGVPVSSLEEFLFLVSARFPESDSVDAVSFRDQHILLLSQSGNLGLLLDEQYRPTRPYLRSEGNEEVSIEVQFKTWKTVGGQYFPMSLRVIFYDEDILLEARNSFIRLSETGEFFRLRQCVDVQARG